VSDGTICLYTLCPPVESEDENMSNRLYFNAREWNFNQDCANNKGGRCFIDGIDGKLTEVYSIGSWDYDWTEIISKSLALEKNTEYSFCFWLNGGENDRNDEVCQLRVVFDDNYDDCLLFKLNRSYIKPLKRYNGWELYDITFRTCDGPGDYCKTQLRFEAMRAVMTIHPAKEPEDYELLPDTVDEFGDLRPQRHNIVYADGWPTNTWYSTKELRRKQQAEKGRGEAQHSTGQDQEAGFSFRFDSGPDTDGWPGFNKDFVIGGMKDEIRRRVLEHLTGSIDLEDVIEELQEDVADEIDLDDIMEEIRDQIDVDSLREEVKSEIMRRLRENL
jgi:hypothetical protein